MGAFALMQRQSGERDEGTRRALQQQFSRQGFAAPRVLTTPGFELHMYPKLDAPAVNVVDFGSDGFCACAGTLIYDGTTGEAALRRVYDEFSASAPKPFDKALGHYCLIVRKHGRTSVMLDRLGIYKVYRNRSAGVWSSSFLACAATLDSASLDTQSVYEYLFQGATYGNSTVLEQIDMLDPLEDPVIEGQRREPHRPTPAWSGPETAWDVDSQLGILRAEYRAIARAFGARIDTALSGGYDSRLTLALLLEQGIRPRLHVYGRDGDADVRVARQIDADLGLGLQHVDKSRAPVPEATAARDVVMQNFLAMDGLPSDGVFSSGADLETRRSRCRDGYLALNGGGGEIYRNFFYLPDRPLSIRQLLWSFYSRFDPRVCTSAFDETGYYRKLGEKLRKSVGADGQWLTRQQVELVYPLFRCRYWMARNNAVNNRFGPAMTPFIEFEAVRAAAAIPLSAKNFGAFEGEMIRQASPALARHDSGYGHDFLSRPPLRRRLEERLVYLRPPWLRRYLYRVKQRSRPADRPPMLAGQRLASVVDVEFPYMRRFVEVAAVRDPEQLNRICTLELLLEQHGSVREAS